MGHRGEEAREGEEVTWAVAVDAKGTASVDLYCFQRLQRVISEHETRPEAVKALEAYRKKAEEEAKADIGQKELF